MSLFRTWAAAPALLATASLVASPAYAAPLPVVTSSPAQAEGVTSYDPADQTYENHRYRRYRHHRGPGLGDVLTGVLIIGGIAAIANRAKRDDDRRYRDRDWRYPEQRRDQARWDDGRGIDRAVGMCVEEVERDRRVETVDRANRTPQGWEISGTVSDGEAFSCAIGEDGRIENVDFGSRGRWRDEQGGDDEFARAPDDRQWDDERYAAERDRMDRRAEAPADEGPQPDYPGGPVDGDEGADPELDVGTGYPGKAI